VQESRLRDAEDEGEITRVGAFGGRTTWIDATNAQHRATWWWGDLIRPGNERKSRKGDEIFSSTTQPVGSGTGPYRLLDQQPRANSATTGLSSMGTAQ
jgi:hypothetical protein